MRLRNTAACFAFLLSFTNFAHARGDLLQGIPLQWTPNTTLAEMGAVDISGALLTMPIYFDAFTDQRQNPSLVGENREDAAKAKPVTTSTDVAKFVGEHVRAQLRTAGLNVTDAPTGIRISAEIRQFFVTETDDYRGEMSLLIHVRNGAGKELWTGIANGGAENFGRSYRADNYCETISNMIMRATYNLLANASFREALQKG